MKGGQVIAALGFILIAFGTIILSPITVALIEHEPEAIAPFVWASAIAISLGFLCRKMGGGRTNFDRLKRNEGMLIVCLAWLSAAAVTAIPYLFFRTVTARRLLRGHVGHYHHWGDHPA